MSVVSIFGQDAEAEARALLKVTAWRNLQPAEPMREADRLLQTILEAGDLVGRDDAGRMVIQLAVEPCDFDRLMAFGADAAESEDGGDGEPYACPPMSPCWFWDGGATFIGRPIDQVLDLLPPKQLGRAARIVQAVVLALLLITGLGLEARADQMPAMTRARPTSTAEAPQRWAVALTVLLGTGFGLEESADQAPAMTRALPMSTAEAPAQGPAMTGALPMSTAEAQGPAMTGAPPTATAEAPAQCCRICKKGKPCGDGCISAERQCKKEQGCACSAASGS
jgi:hypothetical protein